LKTWHKIASKANWEDLVQLMEPMRARELQAKDLWPVFGSRGITSEVLNAKRGISNEVAARLGAFFHVAAAAFISIKQPG
jgi:antitoxin component HigA of HigAB toxin-antitoxin module